MIAVAGGRIYPQAPFQRLLPGGSAWPVSLPPLVLVARAPALAGDLQVRRSLIDSW